MGESGRGVIDVDGRDILVESDYDWSAKSPSTAVVEALAAVEGVDPVALSTDAGITLNDYVDPGCLDRLVTYGRGNDPAVAVPIEEYTVWIDGPLLGVAHTDDVVDGG